VPDLAEPITALSLAVLPSVVALSLRVLRHRLHERLIGEDVDVVLQLDRAARLERNRRRKGGEGRALTCGGR
jgi:hypothetical protein